jgi:hypothetical protein
MTSPFVNEARKRSSITEKVTMAWATGRTASRHIPRTSL